MVPLSMAIDEDAESATTHKLHARPLFLRPGPLFVRSLFPFAGLPKMRRCALSVGWSEILLVWAGFCCLTASAKYTPFLDPGFFFDWNPPAQPVPIPVTAQCETLHIKWGRNGAIGPNPVAPYYLQIYTSTFVTPFIIAAGSGLSFDWDVPFAPGTQYQICMFDKNGITGGCQAIYTVIMNTTVANPICQNVTIPDMLRTVGTVKNGPMSQFGFIDQCTDLSVTPESGTPPFTLTVAPSLHPPYNITSNTMDAINWTVSLSWSFPFFLSLVSSEGLVWANGPMHSGGYGPSDCLAPGTIPIKRAKISAAGAGIGGAFAGVLLGLIAHLFMRYRSGQLKIRMTHYPTTEEKQPAQRTSPLVPGFPHDLEPSYTSNYNNAAPLPPLPPSYPSSSTRSSREEYSTRFAPTDITSNGTPSDTNTPPSPAESNDERSTPLPIRSSQRHAPKLRVASRDSRLESQFNLPSHTSSEPETRDRSQVYVLHHDAGRAPVTVYTGGAKVVELPPTYDPGQQSGSGYGSRLPEK